jgi:dolichyl-phosphate-mannose-protein mannosyltransferase
VAIPPSSPPAIPVQEQPKDEKKSEEVVSDKAAVSPPPEGAPKELPILSKEERVEFRDENGRILNEDEVKALEGKVSFKTRYETRTRIVDAQGNEIHESLVDAREEDGQGVAPPHPDVEGRNPETKGEGEAEPSEVPPTVEVAEDKEKEKSVEDAAKDPRPASEAADATKESAKE